MRRLPREIELVLEALEGLELEDYLLLAAVVLLPWAFGGVEIWAYRGASFLLASAAVVALWKHGWAGLGLDRRARWLLPAFLLVLWGTIQIVPLPPAVIGPPPSPTKRTAISQTERCVFSVSYLRSRSTTCLRVASSCRCSMG